MKAVAAIKTLYHEKICVKTYARIVLFITIMTSSFTAVFIMQQSEVLTDNLVKKGGSLAELLAYNARLCVFAANESMCAGPARGLLHQEDVLSVLIFTLEGRLLTKLDKPGRKMPGSGEGPDNKKPAFVKKKMADGGGHYFEDAGAALNFWAPVTSVSYSSPGEALFFEEKAFSEKEHIIGYVEIIIDKEGLNKQLAVLLRRGFLMGLVFMLIGFAATYFATKRITRPIEKLSAASVEIGKGNLDVNVEVTSGDEIGRLSRLFNKMAADLKESERNYKELNEDLELKVDERTRQLLDAQEDLVRKEKLATLGQLAGSVGHELRNQLGVMNNAVYYLKTIMSGPGETVNEYLNIIKSEIDNSLRIITDLLDFSRTRRPQPESISVDELIDQCLDKCVFPENVMVQVNVPETLPLLKVDPFQMSQVFHNLITNAVQAMPEGGVLRISARRVARGKGQGARENIEAGQGASVKESQKEKTTCPYPDGSSLDPDGDFIEISVTDTGQGISPENMKKLFQPLFTTKAKGIGLGLVICKNLVETNRGKLDVESRLGEGATFTVILPSAGKRQ